MVVWYDNLTVLKGFPPYTHNSEVAALFYRLNYEEKLTQKVIAKRYGVSPTTVSSYIGMAVDLLRYYPAYKCLFDDSESSVYPKHIGVKK